MCKYKNGSLIKKTFFFLQIFKYFIKHLKFESNKQNIFLFLNQANFCALWNKKIIYVLLYSYFYNVSLIFKICTHLTHILVFISIIIIKRGYSAIDCNCLVSYKNKWWKVPFIILSYIYLYDVYYQFESTIYKKKIFVLEHLSVKNVIC